MAWIDLLAWWEVGRWTCGRLGRTVPRRVRSRRGTWRTPGSAALPLMADYAAGWLVRSGRLAPATAVLYRRLLQRLAHAQGRTGSAARRRAGHPARAWARANGAVMPRTGRLPERVLVAWVEPGLSRWGCRRPGTGAVGCATSSRPGRRCRRCAPRRSRTATWSSTRCGCVRGPVSGGDGRRPGGFRRSSAPRCSWRWPRPCPSRTGWRRW